MILKLTCFRNDGRALPLPKPRKASPFRHSCLGLQICPLAQVAKREHLCYHLCHKKRSKKNRDNKMALTRDFKETVKKRVQSDPVFREELLKEGVQCLVSGDMDTGKTILRDYINATVGFEELGDLTDKSPKSLMRMFGPKGNPQARNLFEIIECLQKREGIYFEVRAVH